MSASAPPALIPAGHPQVIDFTGSFCKRLLDAPWCSGAGCRPGLITLAKQRLMTTSAQSLYAYHFPFIFNNLTVSFTRTMPKKAGHNAGTLGSHPTASLIRKGDRRQRARLSAFSTFPAVASRFGVSDKSRSHPQDSPADQSGSPNFHGRRNGAFNAR